MMYTWRDLEKALNNSCQYVTPNYVEGIYSYSIAYDIIDLLENIDIVVDGEFILEEKLYIEDFNDGMFGSIGSGNQRIWDIKHTNDTHTDKYKQKKYNSMYMRELKGIKLNPETNDLIYIKKGD